MRQRLIEDMSGRALSAKTRQDYIRNVAGFAGFLGRSPGTAMAEDIRSFISRNAG
jgi:integrase/recombinase XerD